jgi:hypothetical protein
MGRHQEIAVAMIRVFLDPLQKKDLLQHQKILIERHLAIAQQQKMRNQMDPAVHFQLPSTCISQANL